MESCQTNQKIKGQEEEEEEDIFKLEIAKFSSYFILKNL
jgi:hypothetical protein